MAVQTYRFQEHNLVIEGEKDDLLYIAELLRNAEGTVGDLRYQIEYAFDIDGVRSANHTGIKVFHTTDDELAKYNGTEVEILRPLTEEECDIDDVGMMYKARFYDGYERDVFEDELGDV